MTCQQCVLAPLPEEGWFFNPAPRVNDYFIYTQGRLPGSSDKILVALRIDNIKENLDHSAPSEVTFCTEKLYFFNNLEWVNYQQYKQEILRGTRHSPNTLLGPHGLMLLAVLVATIRPELFDFWREHTFFLRNRKSCAATAANPLPKLCPTDYEEVISISCDDESYMGGDLSSCAGLSLSLASNSSFSRLNKSSDMSCESFVASPKNPKSPTFTSSSSSFFKSPELDSPFADNGLPDVCCIYINENSDDEPEDWPISTDIKVTLPIKQAPKSVLPISRSRTHLRLTSTPTATHPVPFKAAKKQKIEDAALSLPLAPVPKILEKMLRIFNAENLHCKAKLSLLFNHDKQLASALLPIFEQLLDTLTSEDADYPEYLSNFCKDLGLWHNDLCKQFDEYSKQANFNVCALVSQKALCNRFTAAETLTFNLLCICVRAIARLIKKINTTQDFSCDSDNYLRLSEMCLNTSKELLQLPNEFVFPLPMELISARILNEKCIDFWHRLKKTIDVKFMSMLLRS